MNTIKKFINTHIETLDEVNDICCDYNVSKYDKYNVTMAFRVRDFNQLFNRGPRQLVCAMVLDHLLATLDKVCDKVDFTDTGDAIYTVGNQRIMVRFNSDHADEIPGRS